MLTSSREPSHLRNERALDLINPNIQCEVPLPHQTTAHLLAWGPSMISPETKSINFVRVSEMSYRDTGEVKSTDTSTGPNRMLSHLSLLAEFSLSGILG